MADGRRGRVRCPDASAKLLEQLPSTPDQLSKCDVVADSPCILLHGQPLNTPAKVHFGLIQNTICLNEKEECLKGVQNNTKAKSRKNSFQRAVDVNKETMENTKRNSGYSFVEIVTETVRVDGQKPSSPSAHFSKTAGKRARKQKIASTNGANYDSMARSVRFRDIEIEDYIVNEPPFYDIQIPLKSIMKKKQTPPHMDWDMNKKEKIIVKRYVYDDNDDAPLVDRKEADLAINSDDYSLSLLRVKTTAKPARINAPARRIVR